MAKYKKPKASSQYDAVKNRIEKLQKQVKKQRKRLDKLIKKII